MSRKFISHLNRTPDCAHARSGLGRFGGTGLTAGEVDAVLEGGFNTNAEALYHELNVLTQELNAALDAVK